MAIDTKKLKAQSTFCLHLMARLDSDIANAINENAWQGVSNYTQKKQDIIRLRRELNALNKLLEPWGESR